MVKGIDPKLFKKTKRKEKKEHFLNLGIIPSEHLGL